MVLRVGIVSAAWGGFAHLPAWRAVPGVEVTAICTSRRKTAEAAAARLALSRAFWDAEALCADPDIDIVDCGTRPSVRLPMVLSALRHGKHVYNACPHAPDWTGARQIDAAWRGSSAIGVVDAFAGWIPALRQMTELVRTGFLGDVLGGSCRLNLSLFNRPDPRFPYTWFADPQAGVSALRNNGSHLLHLLLPMLGPILRVSGGERRLIGRWTFTDGTTRAAGNADHADVLLEFASGLIVPLQVSWVMPLHSGFAIDLFGREGRLVAESPTFPTAPDCVLKGGRIGETLMPLPVPQAFGREPGIGLDQTCHPAPSYPMALSMQAMVRAIRGEAGAASDFAAAFAVERVLEAIRTASHEQRAVAIAEVTDSPDLQQEMPK